MSVLLQRERIWGDLVNRYTGELTSLDDPDAIKWMPLHEHQQKVVQSRARFTAACAGTGGGKTVTGPIWCIDKIQTAIQKYGSVLGMIIAPTYKVLARATAPTFVNALRHTELEGEYKESKSYYELPNNWGKIWLQGADNPGGLEGGQFDFVWGDEGGQFRKKTFDAITGRTGAKMAPVLITTTPYGLGALYTEWYKKYKAGDKDYNFVHWSSHLNPGYPDEEYERAKRTMTPEKFQERYDGRFMKPEGLVYPDYERTLVNLSSSELSLILEQPGRFVGGIDYGWNDPFCALLGYLTSSNDVLWIFWERYRSQKTLEQHAEYLPKPVEKSILWWSEHNPDAIRRLNRGGHKVKKAKKLKKGNLSSAILNGIMMVNNRIYTDRLKIVREYCPAIVGEFELYKYPDKDDEIIGDIPEDKDNHAMDALRYIIMSEDSKEPA